MKRKIKITSKMIKKSVLWAILVVLVVGLGIIVVQSFGNDHILSSNTQLQDVDYSDEYRLYLEKQLIIKSNTDSYETVLEAQKVIEVNSITTLKEAKILEKNSDYKIVLEDEETEKFLKEKIRQAEELCNALDKREKTIVRIARFIMENQNDFLYNGSEYLRPVTMSQAAEKLELHDSTVSRACSDKYLKTPQGVFPFKFQQATAVVTEKMFHLTPLKNV